MLSQKQHSHRLDGMQSRQNLLHEAKVSHVMSLLCDAAWGYASEYSGAVTVLSGASTWHTWTRTYTVQLLNQKQALDMMRTRNAS
jgi:hypothetical protein